MLLICSENTFWSQTKKFSVAFSDAFDLYQNSTIKKSIENALDQVGSYPGETVEKILVAQFFQEKKQQARQAKQEIYKNSITDIILAYHLCM